MELLFYNYDIATFTNLSVCAIKMCSNRIFIYNNEEFFFKILSFFTYSKLTIL